MMNLSSHLTERETENEIQGHALQRVEKEELEKALTGIMEEFKAASSGEEQFEIHKSIMSSWTTWQRT